MAQSTVRNLMIEMKSFDNDSMRIRLDNPKEGITRAQIAEVMQPAFTNNWIMTEKGSTAGYLGETVLETSTKIKLEGEDFYVTPNEIIFTTGSGTQNATLTVTGAQIQGYNIKQIDEGGSSTLSVKIAENGLSATVTTTAPSSGAYGGTWNLILIIRGAEVTIPVKRQ